MTTRTTTRRAVLAGTAAAMVPAVAGAACLAPDPIFAVIAEHDAAYHLEVATYERESAL